MSAQPAGALPATRLLIAGEWADGAARQPVIDKYRLRPCGELHVAGREHAGGVSRQPADAARARAGARQGRAAARAQH